MSQLCLQHSVSRVLPHAIISYSFYIASSQLSLGYAINRVPLHMIIEYSPSHGPIPLCNFTFDIPPMEYPCAQLFNVFSNIALSYVATLSLTFHQQSTPMCNHLTFFLRLPHPVLQIHLQHAINGVPLCVITEHSLTLPHPMLQLCLQHPVNRVPPHHFVSFIFLSPFFIPLFLTFLTSFSLHVVLPPAHCPHHFYLFTYTFHFTSLYPYLTDLTHNILPSLPVCPISIHPSAPTYVGISHWFPSWFSQIPPMLNTHM